LGEALEAQEAASKRSDDLKQLQPEGLMELFTPEKGNGAAVKAHETKNKGQKEKQQQPPQQREAAAEAAAGVASMSPKKKEGTPKKKRSRKVTEKAAKVGLEDYEDEEEEEDAVKKPKKQTNGTNHSEKKKQSVKRGEGVWNGEEYPRIVAVLKCDDDDGVRVEVHAKKPGRGQWQKVLFSLGSAQLDSIDELPEKTKQLVKGSFHKALTGRYGQKWPNALRLALAGTVWAKDILPAGDGWGLDGDGDFVGLESLANLSDV